MALIEPYMVKSDLDLGADEVLELEAKSGESLLVKDVVVYGTDDSYVLLEIDKTTVGFFRTLYFMVVLIFIRVGHWWQLPIFTIV